MPTKIAAATENIVDAIDGKKLAIKLTAMAVVTVASIVAVHLATKSIEDRT